MKRTNLFKVLDFAKIPAILLGVFLLVKWITKHGKETLKNWFPAMGANPLIFDPMVIAKKQFDAMFTWGTREKDLFNSLKLSDGSDLTGEQLKQVFEAFGFQPYGFGGGLAILGSNKNLFEWYDAELAEKEKSQMRDIWHKSGLNITF